MRKAISPIGAAIEYKKFIFYLLNNLELIKHELGEKVITQNDTVLDEDGSMNKASTMYFIISGLYKVQSGMYELGNKYTEFKE